jgi:Wiskott-Aldrich syndrome protein
VPGAEPSSGPAGGSGPATPGADAGLAGALASALAARKAKVSHSGKCNMNASGCQCANISADDESDKDDW